jgi:DNA anti-recombination protein RmuC
MNLTGDNIILESEANSTVKANPVMEVNRQNSEVTTFNSDNATISDIATSLLQDLFATVMTAIQTEGNKQTAAFQTEAAKLTETLKLQFKQENEKLAASLTESFEAANTKLREEFNVKLQHEIRGVSDRVDILSRDTGHKIDSLNKSVENLSEGMSKKVNAHITQTRKEFEKGKN